MRTWPVARRSATVATVSVVLLVQELTAKIRSPRESLGRGLRICVFFMGVDADLEHLRCHFVQTLFCEAQTFAALGRRSGFRAQTDTFVKQSYTDCVIARRKGRA